MNTDWLPAEVKGADEPGQAAGPRPLFWLVALIALVVGWQVLGLPGQLVSLHEAPPDMPWAGVGYRKVYVTAEGRYGINRRGYVDRLAYYEISPTGQLSTYQDNSDALIKLDISGIPHGGNTMFSDGSLVRVLPGEHLWKWLRSLREDDPPQPPQVTTVDNLFGEVTGIPHLDSADQVIREYQGAVYLDYLLFGQEESVITKLLEGHHFFRPFDSYAVVEPVIWLTSDRLRWLHRVELVNTGQQIEADVVLSVPIEIDRTVARNCVVGYDPATDEVFLLLADGTKLVYDPLSLGLLREETLPGNWEFEYATLFGAMGEASYDWGIPLSQTGYNWLMRCLMVVFIGSLLWLALNWRQAWKFISATTTAEQDSSDGSASSSTPAD